MKKYIIFSLLPMILFSCDWINQEDPVFDYNKKSAEVIETNNNFGLTVLKQIILTDTSDNLLISPASISLALGMAYNGAESTTRDAFEEVLNYEGLTRQEINEISLDLITTLVTNSSDNTLEIANSIWQHQDFPVKETFIDLNENYFDAAVYEEDFGDNGTVEKINQWVSDKTHEKIEKIIDELSPEARLVLINALYFNCLWEYEFDPDETRVNMFYKEDETSYGEVEMMTTESKFNYASTDDFTAVELPYKDDKFSMHLFLPENGNTVNSLIEMLDGTTWNSWLEEYTLTDKVQVTMPKFKFEYERQLGQDLKDMGLEIAFTDEADFSGISDIKLFISQVIHKTYIDVNEEGTEAAAVTAIVFETTAVGEDGPVIVRFNRPFLFAITENSSNSIVFMGKMSAPGYEE